MNGGYEMSFLQMKGMSENEWNGCCDKQDEWQPLRNVIYLSITDFIQGV